MDTERILDFGERGIHVLFDREMIRAAYSQEPRVLRAVVDQRLPEIHAAVAQVLSLGSAGDGRAFVASLHQDVRNVLVLLYFELLEERLRKRETRH
jgi:nitrogen regulatory protein PII